MSMPAAVAYLSGGILCLVGCAGGVGVSGNMPVGPGGFVRSAALFFWFECASFSCVICQHSGIASKWLFDGGVGNFRTVQGEGFSANSMGIKPRINDILRI